MEHVAKVITIGTWTGMAVLVDGAWYVRPQSIAESMALEWPLVRNKIILRWADDLIRVEMVYGMGNRRALLMPVHLAVQWLAGFAGNNHMAAERRVIAKAMAAAIALQFSEHVLANGRDTVTDDFVPLPKASQPAAEQGGRHG